ncbi:TrkH family potassium uptake protein [Anaerobiospirillum sp. NML120448]|uniref:TrkH family potassium uptake protein n=1 Tax=Anaerobiospirillum sp. NML120448 TaxID=2932816 RepID=UPI001FF46622|nr:potassium transporter TrkG [Anaerobiospirillum sp. NML120448]MCK0514699.1 TrkH family potassium uptake protein [Anaerobiospirillum sp. NML120448]
MVINLYAVSKLLGPSLIGMAFIGLIPTVYALFTNTEGASSFVVMIVIAFSAGKILSWLGKKAGQYVVTIRELFLFTASLWVAITLISAIPIYVLLPDVDYAGAIFESASGLSTTGATAINHLDDRPAAILLWRSMLQLMGGIGFVVIAVAVLPQVAMGGMNIFKTESTYFENSNKFTPHMKTMSLAILGWYLVTFVLCTIAFIIGGLDFFMAINAAACTVATGGMMPTDASMNGMSNFVHYSAIVFMFLSSCPFTVIIAGISGNISKLFSDQQVKYYFLFTLFMSLMVTATLYFKNEYDLERAFRVATFNVVSVLSTSGFALEDFTLWNPIATLLFLILLPLGGCSGSTSGGIKIFRLCVFASLFRTQMIKSIHPHRVIYPRFNGLPIDAATIHSIMTFFAVYIVCALISSLTATALGLNITDAITATITCLSNVGPAMGPQLSPSDNFANLDGSLHILFAFDMILGRLEIIPVLLCLTRIFWRA